MSHNENIPEKGARKHSPAMIAILVALVVAAGAAFLFGASDPEPADPTTGNAVVTNGAIPEDTDVISPDAGAPTPPPAVTDDEAAEAADEDAMPAN